ncbi:enoyl-CoA hydratase/isomerase family protein [Rhodohalobacter sp. 614A]|uniref:enoyl-CoA hydratase/isomerase family protein n=1 Tax=Rhodohalobacter sp. 614A TaxID=2908649 RepID=UPI001F261C92|nr:enoyl-CoA hydratase/isomerase family protein [Rhodohalobacter sp. 614A]
MPLIIQKEPFIVQAAINRPEAMNAINFEVMNALESLLDELEQDHELRLFILTGAGSSFISGGDLREFHQIKDADGAKEMTRRMMSVLSRIEQLPCWTLAAVNGPAYGGGWETLLAFDFRIAISTATFGFTQGKFYLPPGWGGITKLTETVGRDQAMYWLASHKMIDAETAWKSGLIQDVFGENEYDQKLTNLKKALVKNDRKFIQYIKRKDLLKSEDEIEPFSTFWESEEHLKRVDDFLKRKK